MPRDRTASPHRSSQNHRPSIIPGRVANHAIAPAPSPSGPPSGGTVEAGRPEAVLVGTYPPTECGLATYTANLCAALRGAGVQAGVIRLLDEPDHHPADPVVFTWDRSSAASMAAAVDVTDRFDLVLLQHEFGIYPGRDGGDVMKFVERCRRPVLSVLHTVVPQPTPSQRAIVEALVRRSAMVVVHSEIAYSRLLSVFDVDPARLAVVPHGATINLTGEPLITSTRPIMLTWGLLGPGKGIEHGIEAVSIMRSGGLDVRYIVVGETHPNVRMDQGERYREGLGRQATARGVADLVEFVGGYHDWDALRALVRSADVVLLPYDSRDQVTSGVLVEALAAGKPVVATAFPHAVELSGTGAVAVVAHESPALVADAVRSILTQPALRERMETAARAEGMRYDWQNIGVRFRDLIESTVGAVRHPEASA